jgi:transcriptional regulator with XRE-family HTH domain
VDMMPKANSTTRTTARPQLRISWDSFGEFLKTMRRRRGISQENLSRRLNCHRTYIYRLENGHRRPSRIFLRLLAETLTPSEHELEILGRFEYLREYHSDAIEQDV